MAGCGGAVDIDRGVAEGTNILERLRAAEMEAIRPWFSRGMRVLELGGGNGFQAMLLTGLGCDVSSIDVDPWPPDGTERHPVVPYDGRHIPFPNEAFDLVFSSNVLEHVVHVADVFAEMRRVSRPHAIGVHIVPSTAWRFWTSTGHYPWLARRLLRGPDPRSPKEPDIARSVRRNTPAQLAWKALGLAAHGEHASALAELYEFSRRRWREVFVTNGFEPIHEMDTSLFYTGYSLLPDLSIDVRHRLARVLGSACHVFVVRPRS